ncbi:MAG: TMEM175 family protein [Thermoanaerobaculia bacterium]
MGKGRLEAFSDGVIAILITIMVLELRAPHAPDLAALRPLLPVFMSYLLSFVYLGIYWNNHHHMLHLAARVNGSVLWPNLHLLFWLSLVPFVTSWMGENPRAVVPTALYGAVLLMSGVAYFFLARALARLHGADSKLARALGKDFKGILSLALYAVGIALSALDTRLAQAIFVGVAILWIVPDRRMERVHDS